MATLLPPPPPIEDVRLRKWLDLVRQSIGDSDPLVDDVKDAEAIAYASLAKEPGIPLRVLEADGTPDVMRVRSITVTNGTLTDDGSGDITLDLTGTGTATVWEQIERATFSTSTSETIGGSQTASDYDEYILLVTSVSVSTDGAIVSVWASTDAGVSKVTAYTRAGVFRRSASTDGAFANESAAELAATNAIDTGKSNRLLSMKIEMSDPGASTHKNSWERLIFVDNGTASNMFQQIQSTQTETTSAIDSFIMEVDTGTMTGAWTLLGLKKTPS